MSIGSIHVHGPFKAKVVETTSGTIWVDLDDTNGDELLTLFFRTRIVAEAVVAAFNMVDKASDD